MTNEQRTYVYLNFDIDPFTAELVFPQGVPKGGCVSLVFGSFDKSAVSRETKFTEEFARMVSQKFRVSSPLVRGGPQCFIRISLMKDGPPQAPKSLQNGAESLPKDPTASTPRSAAALTPKAVAPGPKTAAPAPKTAGADVPSLETDAASAPGNDDDVEDMDQDDDVQLLDDGSLSDDGPDDSELDLGDESVEKGPFVCRTCDKSFSFYFDLTKHEAVDHGIFHVCEHCRKKFVNKFGLVRHLWSHLPPGRLPFRCGDCKMTFITRKELVVHKNLPHGTELPLADGKPHAKKVVAIELDKDGQPTKDTNAAGGKGRQKLQTKPSDEDIYFCEFCAEVYLTSHFYKQHIAKHHALKLNEAPDDIADFTGIARDPEDPSKLRCAHCDECTDVGFRELCQHLCDKHPESKVYPCPKCTLIFPTEAAYESHIVTHVIQVTASESRPGHKDYHCNRCGEVEVSRKALVRHMQLHYKDPDSRPFACEVCPATFRLKSSLLLHTKRHSARTKQASFPCSTCPKVFTAKHFLKRHEEVVHARILPYACPHCSKKFYFERHLQQHLVMSHRSKLSDEEVKGLGLIHNFQCEECGFTSYSERTIRRHVYAHTGTFPFVCEECNRGFVFRFELTAHHARRHLHQKLRCQHCPRVFYIEERFKRHLSAHEENWGMSCPVCNQLFETQGYLESHMQRHSGKTPYECSDCGKRFSAPQGLTFHKQQHHERQPRQGARLSEQWPHSCEVCGIRFKYLSSQQAHMACHHPATDSQPLECTYCQRKLASKLALSQHLRKHTNEKYKCKHCDRGFQSYVGCRTHQIVMHTRKFKMACPICEKGCISFFELKKHLKQSHKAVVVREQVVEEQLVQDQLVQEHVVQEVQEIQEGEYQEAILQEGVYEEAGYQEESVEEECLQEGAFLEQSFEEGTTEVVLLQLSEGSILL
ncbi:zinc finger protein 569 [Ixodes scapularis]|nr:zinc finger protein 569 [Ixodes scapularis]